jgi:putative transposase
LKYDTRNVRQLTPEIDPYRRSIWTKEALKDAIERYFFEDYDQRTHTSLLVSPRQAFESSQAVHGCSPHRFVSFDETFLILSSATTKDGAAKVQADGVKINYLYYNHPALRFHLEKSVPIRFDPFNLANAWAHVDGSWLKLTSRFASVLINHSEHDVAVVTAAWRKRRSAVEAEALADTRLIRLLQDIQTEEEWLAQRQLSIAERDLRRADEPNEGFEKGQEICDAVEMTGDNEPSPRPPEPRPRVEPQPRRLRLTRKLREVEVL